MCTETLLELVDRVLAKHENSSSLVVMNHYDATVTFDEWLGLNNLNIDDPFDAELFDTMPEQFHEEYTARFSNFVRNNGGIQ